MDGQDYLNQISAANRPVKTSKFKHVLSSKFFLIGIAAISALIIIIIIGSIISGNKTDVKTLSIKLNLHLENTSSVIKNYQNDIKSSSLRAASASLDSILSNTKNDLTTFITENYGSDAQKSNENLIIQATTEKDGLDNELFEAKINGILDRIYAHKMSYEISMITSEESKIINSTSNEQLKNLLIVSHDSLSILFDSFNNFSETK